MNAPSGVCQEGKTMSLQARCPHDYGPSSGGCLWHPWMLDCSTGPAACRSSLKQSMVPLTCRLACWMRMQSPLQVALSPPTAKVLAECKLKYYRISECMVMQLFAHGPQEIVLWHYEMWKYCQSTNRMQAYVLQNLRVSGDAVVCSWPPGDCAMAL